MVRVLYLIKNGSYRFDHRPRREVCQYVDGGDPRGLAEQVNLLAGDKKLRTKLGEAGLKRVKEVLSWPHQAPNLLHIYEDLFPGQIEWGTYSASA